MVTPEQQAVIDAAVELVEAGAEVRRLAVAREYGPRAWDAERDHHNAAHALDAAVERMQAVRHG